MTDNIRLRGMPHDSVIKHFPPVTIGKHEWLIAVHSHYSGRCTAYYWRRKERESWESDDFKDAETWSTYNHNDGSFGGMPRTLANYYETHEDAINALLAFQPIPEPKQSALAFDFEGETS